VDPIAKKILNSLKCPICGGQIDLLTYKKPISSKGNNFGCVVDQMHYAIFFVHWEAPIRIEKETVMLYEGTKLYEVKQEHYFLGRPVPCTDIYIKPVDLENRVLDNIKPKHFHFNKLLFDFTKTNREKLLNRIKTILVFQ
jgi:hypothetical protein